MASGGLDLLSVTYGIEGTILASGGLDLLSVTYGIEGTILASGGFIVRLMMIHNVT